jgi:hypothetical protein
VEAGTGSSCMEECSSWKEEEEEEGKEDPRSGSFDDMNKWALDSDEDDVAVVGVIEHAPGLDAVEDGLDGVGGMTEIEGRGPFAGETSLGTSVDFKADFVECLLVEGTLALAALSHVSENLMGGLWPSSWRDNKRLYHCSSGSKSIFFMLLILTVSGTMSLSSKG